MRRVVIVGGHGDGLVAAQVIRDLQRAGAAVECAGFLNDAVPAGGEIAGLPVIGRTREWASLPDDVGFHVALHKVGRMSERAALIESFAIPDARLVTLVHPTACVADDVTVGPGALVASHVTCQPASVIGRYVSIRAGANVGHDVRIEDFAYVGPNATLCGRSVVRRGAHAGPNSVVTDAVCLGAFSVLSAGAVATRDTDEGSVSMGNPARRIG